MSSSRNPSGRTSVHGPEILAKLTPRPATVSYLAHKTGLNEAQVRHAAKTLVKQGKVEVLKVNDHRMPPGGGWITRHQVILVLRKVCGA